MGYFQKPFFSLKNIGMLAVVAGALSACGDTNKPLPGERLSIRGPDAAAVVNRVASISLPSATVNGGWPNLNGSAAHTIGHVAFSNAPSLRWSTDIGAGVGRDNRITSGPVGANGLVFAFDAAGHLSAVDANGAIVWTLDTAPAGERSGDGDGGGVSISNGVLYAATGFGEVLAISPASGGVIWRRGFEAPFRAPPVSNGRNVYVVTRADVAYGIKAEDGSLEWVQRGVASNTGAYDGGSGPALKSGQVVLPFTSGDMMMVNAASGQPKWREALDGVRRTSALGNIGDIAGAPVISGNTVFAANLAGQTVSLNLQSGKRNWALASGAVGPVWPVGGSVFLVSDQAELMRVNANNGQVIWSQQMAQYAKPEKRKGLIRYYGPVLGGGLMWVAARDGSLRGYSLESGAVAVNLSVPNGAAASPIFVGGVMYVLSLDGELHAFQ